MSCNWQEEDYFSLLMRTDKKSHMALEMLVDDLHCDKEKTITKFLNHSGAEDFLWGLVRLLGNDNSRVAGNAAYIIGTVAESDMGCHRILGLAKGNKAENRKILQDLTRMLTFDDAESVMNAAGTMGTLAESYEGREWMLSEPCLFETLQHITTLLQAENLWTASNAALVLARLSISENGCMKILDHENSQHILTKLIYSLGVDEAGRGMNAAFAIGRLCDIELGRKRLLMLTDSERMLSSLAKMLSCDDTGASKNACFALSCLATNTEGHTRLLNNIHSDDILRTLSNLLSADDSETGWFAAMTLRTLASQPRGCLRLREHSQVIPALKTVEKKSDSNPDLKEEASITLEILKKLEKPSPPKVEVVGHDTIRASWQPVSTKSGFQVRYQLFDCKSVSASKCVYTGKECSCQVTGLQPCSQYTYKIRAYTEGDESPFSDTVTVVTEESVPKPPINLRVLGCTISQLKIGWDPPEQINGTLKGYYVYQGDKMIEHTNEQTAIVSGLQSSTSYELEVCAATSKGKGERAYIVATTSEIGAHAPSKPQVQVLGRHEVNITWDAPEVPLGRITRYDLLMNHKIIYSGTDLSYTVRRLTPDTEYSFVVVALTSEGKFDSKITKKRTAKDEYDSSRPPLYQPPPPRRDSLGEELKLAQTQKKKKPLSQTPDIKTRAVSSAKQRSVTPGKEKNKNPEQVGTRPSSASSSLISTQVSQEKDLRETNGDVDHVSVEPAVKARRKEATKPTIESKKENVRSYSKPKTPVQSIHYKETHSNAQKVNHKTERSSSVGKIFPVSVSYVSIQGEGSNENAPKPESEKRMFYRSGTFVEQPSMQNMKVERSRTMLHSGRVKGRNYGKMFSDGNNSTSSNHVGNSSYINSILGKNSDLSNGNPVMKNSPDATLVSNPMSFDSKLKHPRSISNSNSGIGKPIINDIQPIAKSSKSVKVVSTVNESRVSSADNKSSHVESKSSYDHRNRNNVHEKHKGNPRDIPLPKPSLPSQQYLEGGTQGWASRSLPSPRTLAHHKETEATEHDVIAKRLFDQASRGNYLAMSKRTNDCSYFLNMHEEYIQRTNNYVNVHRKVSYGERDDSKTTRLSLPSLPRQRNSRPGNKRGPEKIRSNEGIPPMPVVPNAQFALDLPDNKSTMTTWNRTFIPMQLRTQPANLPPSQLQRVNTTLGDQAKGVQFKRVEAITRSQTLLDMKQSTSALTLGEQAERFPIHSASAKDRHSARMRKIRNNRLTRSPSAHQREPDSMILQQSWSSGASHEGTLQSAG